MDAYAIAKLIENYDRSENNWEYLEYGGSESARIQAKEVAKQFLDAQTNENWSALITAWEFFIKETERCGDHSYWRSDSSAIDEAID